MIKTKIAVCAVCLILALVFIVSCAPKGEQGKVSIWSSTGELPYDYSLAKYIVLGEYNGIDVNKIELSYNPDVRISHGIAKLFPEYAIYKETEAASSGTVLTVKISSICDGKSTGIFDADSFKVVIDGATSFDGVDDPYVARLVGACAEFALSSYDGSAHVTQTDFVCPEYFDLGNCAGKTVTLNFDVLSVKELSLETVPDEYVMENTDYTGISELRAALSSEYEIADEALIKEAYRNILWHSAQSDATVISLPKAELERCVNEYVDYYRELAAYNGCSYEEYLSREGIKGSEISDEAEDYADRKVRYEMVVFAIAQDEDLLMTKNEFDELVLDLARASGYESYDEFIRYNGEEAVYVYLTWQKVVDHIVANAQFA